MVSGVWVCGCGCVCICACALGCEWGGKRIAKEKVGNEEEKNRKKVGNVPTKGFEPGTSCL